MAAKVLLLSQTTKKKTKKPSEIAQNRRISARWTIILYRWRYAVRELKNDIYDDSATIEYKSRHRFTTMTTENL